MNLSSDQPFNGESVYKNQYALPLGYNVSEDALAEISYGRDPFENQERFMNGLLGGNNIVILCGLMAIKVGLIKKSNSLCNTIVGL